MLLVTLALFPFLYLTLELPKRIINDAIGAGQSVIEIGGFSLSQTGFLWLLCTAFLVSVLLHGLLKMRINTMKGVLAERMLRRFRYLLVTRMFRFPKPFFQRTSQAEIVSMVTAESEPLGGMMGDAISQPILQAGQMLTILAFLFLQSFWFGLAAIALIPLQAWIIPILQRRINTLNKRRIKEVRALAAEIGETAAGAADLRTSGGQPYRAAQITHRLGGLFLIRLDIYRKKFFMKFLNNFITQLTPFFFFAIGGYLVIQGNVSLGALVAALAAYKDLSSPWKELLTYYNQYHEMAQRWQLITDHFAPAGVLDAALVEGMPDADTSLEGDIVLKQVAAHDGDGLPVVQGLDLTFRAGGTVAIIATSAEERQAMTELLTRELIPSEGQITIGGQDLSALHQVTIGAHVGAVGAQPYIFAGSIGDNIFLPLRRGTPVPSDDPRAKTRHEAARAGNSERLLEDTWIDPAEQDAMRGWWLSLVEGMGADQELIRRTLGMYVTPQQAPEICKAVVALRETIQLRLREDGLTKTLAPFDHATYNRHLPLIHNILCAVPTRPLTQGDLAADAAFLAILRRLGLVDDVLKLAQEVVDLLHNTFGADGTHHPLFQRLGIKASEFEAAVRHSASAETKATLKEDELALLLALPCVIGPEHIASFLTQGLEARVVAGRASAQGRLGDLFEPLDPNAYLSGLSLVENAVFGTLTATSGTRMDLVLGTVGAVLAEQGHKTRIATLSLDEETLLGGSNLPGSVRESVGFLRAAIKKPDVLVLNTALASHNRGARASAMAHLRKMLPKATIIQIEPQFDDLEPFDQVIELTQGRIAQGHAPDVAIGDVTSSTPDRLAKFQAIKQTVFFSGVDDKQLRLLAFSAQSFECAPGEMVFEMHDDPSDGVYLILQGEADFFFPQPSGAEQHIRTAGPGSLVGELALILGEPRTLSMRAMTELKGLRIGSDEFLSVIQNDATTSFKLMQLIAGYAAGSNAQRAADLDQS